MLNRTKLERPHVTDSDWRTVLRPVHVVESQALLAHHLRPPAGSWWNGFAFERYCIYPNTFAAVPFPPDAHARLVWEHVLAVETQKAPARTDANIFSTLHYPLATGNLCNPAVPTLFLEYTPSIYCAIRHKRVHAQARGLVLESARQHQCRRACTLRRLRRERRKHDAGPSHMKPPKVRFETVQNRHVPLLRSSHLGA